MGYAGIFCPSATEAKVALQVPGVPAGLPDKFWSGCAQKLSPEAGGIRAPFRSGRTRPGLLDPDGGLPPSPRWSSRCSRGDPAGGMTSACRHRAGPPEKELHRIGKLFEALISYRMLQSEIAFRTRRPTSYRSS